MVKHESHLCRVVSHRLGRDSSPRELALVITVQQFPFSDVLGEHALHDVGELGLYFGVQFRVVDSTVSRANGNRSGIVERSDSGHLHDGNLAIFGGGKRRIGKLERGIVIADAQGGRALARDRPATRDIG